MAGASHALVPDTVVSGDATSKPVAEIMVLSPSTALGSPGYKSGASLAML